LFEIVSFTLPSLSTTLMRSTLISSNFCGAAVVKAAAPSPASASVLMSA
jgi:hypothetical protein